MNIPYTRSLLLLFLGLFVITQWSSSTYLPIIAELREQFSGHADLITSSLSVFLLGYAIGQFFWGVISDYIGRYKSLLTALVLYCFFEIAISFSQTGWHFVILLACTGFAIAANTSVGTALLKEVYGRDKMKKIIGSIGIAMASAPVIAPIISTNLYALAGWQSIFYFLCAVGIVLAASFSIRFRHYNNGKTATNETAPIATMIKTTLSDKQFIAYVLILGISFGILFSMLLAIPFLLAKVPNISLQQSGYIIFCVTASMIVGTILNWHYADKLKTQHILLAGLTLIFIAALLLGIEELIYYSLLSAMSLIACAIAMLGIGIAIPACKAGAMVARDQYLGTAASIMKLSQAAIGVLATKFTAFALNYDANVLSAVLFILSIIMLIGCKQCLSKTN